MLWDSFLDRRKDVLFIFFIGFIYKIRRGLLYFNNLIYENILYRKAELRKLVGWGDPRDLLVTISS